MKALPPSSASAEKAAVSTLIAYDMQTSPYGNSSYLPGIWSLLYASLPLPLVESKIRAIPLSNGVCAKAFTKNDVGWFCSVCQKDSNCVFCQSCFENSDHAGHPVYLKRSVNGCCDCGDHEAWDPKGFCTAHQGFTDESKAGVALLPSEIRQSAPQTISQLVARLFSVGMTLFTKDANAETGLEPEIAAILITLRKISDITPIFMYEVCRNLLESRGSFRIPNEGSEPGFHDAALSEPVCALELFLWIHHKLRTETRKLLNNFCIQHLRSHGFKIMLGELYLRNYPTLISNGMRVSEHNLQSLSCQVLGSDEVAAKVLASAELRAKLMSGTRASLSWFAGHQGRNAFYNAIETRCDIKYLVKPGSVGYLLQNGFLQEFAAACSALSYINVLPMLSEHIPFGMEGLYYSLECEVYVLKTFVNVARCANLEDRVLCRSIALGFKKLVPELAKQAAEAKGSFFNIPVHRCLSFFVCNYLYVQLLSSRHDSPADGYNVGFYVRRDLKELFDISTDAEYNEFVRACLFPVLKSVGFLLEVQAQKWVHYGQSVDAISHVYMDKKRGLNRYDLSLLSLLLGSYAEPVSSLMEFLVGTLAQEDGWLSGYVQLLMDEGKTGKDIAAGLEMRHIDPKKASAIMEQVLFLLCGLCSADCLCLPIFFRGVKPKIVKQPYYQNMSPAIEKLKEHALTKELVHAYFKCKSPLVTVPQLLEQLPGCYGKFPALVSTLEKVAAKIANPAKSTEVYKLKPEYLKYYDPFFYAMQGNVGTADENAEEAFRKCSDPKLFNPLFGAPPSASKDQEYNPDLCSAMSQTLAASGFPRLVRAIVQRGAAGEVTDGISIYSLKLLRTMREYTTKSELPAVKPLLGQLRGRLVHYGNLLSEIESDLDELPAVVGPAEETKGKHQLDAKAKRKKVMEEFKGKGAAFAEKHLEILKRLKEEESAPESGTETGIVCGICKEPLNETTFSAQPFGQLVNICVSGAYSHFLRQNTEPEYWPLLDPKHRVHAASLVLQPCGHYMHYKCIMTLIAGEESTAEEELMEMLGIAQAQSMKCRCPLCSAPFTYLLPPSVCLEKIGEAKTHSLPVVTSILRTIGSQFGAVDKRSEVTRPVVVEYLSSMLCYQTRMSDVARRPDQGPSFKLADAFRSLIAIVKAECPPENTATLTSATVVEDLAQGLRTGASAIMSQDYLQLLAQTMILLRMERRIEQLNSAVLRFLQLHLLQVTMKLVYSAHGSAVSAGKYTVDPKAFEQILVAHSAEIKSLALPWIMKAITIKLVVEGDTNGQTVIETVMSALDEATRFDMAVDHLGYTKDLRSLVVAASEEGVVGADEAISLINREISAYQSSALIPIQIRILGATKPFSLTQLEEDYMELQKIHYKRRCKHCGLQVKDSAICLLCGEILCVRSECCMYGTRDELWQHAKECSYGTGIFLYFWTNCVILRSGDEATLYSSPYTNQFGESIDISKRITFEPIRLNAGMLNELKKMYVQDRVYHTIKTKKAS